MATIVCTQATYNMVSWVFGWPTIWARVHALATIFASMHHRKMGNLMPPIRVMPLWSTRCYRRVWCLPWTKANMTRTISLRPLPLLAICLGSKDASRPWSYVWRREAIWMLWNVLFRLSLARNIRCWTALNSKKTRLRSCKLKRWLPISSSLSS